jgi:hypothetical protein
MEAFKLALDQYRLPHIGILKYLVVVVELAAGIINRAFNYFGLSSIIIPIQYYIPFLPTHLIPRVP